MIGLGAYVALSDFNNAASCCDRFFPLSGLEHAASIAEQRRVWVLKL